MRKLFYIDSRRNIKLMFCLLFLFIPIRYANSASYTLMSVGESLTVSQTTYMGGYISKVALAATLDAHLSFRDNGVGDAVITVNSYFNYETTVKLVFVERYQSFYSGRLHNLSHTYYKDVPIRCKYQAPDPSKKPKKVKLPERVRVPLGERVTVEPVLEPYGAIATSSSWDFHIPWTTCHTYQVENSINCQLVGMKLGYGEATITINGDEKLSASTIIEVIDPNNPSPENIIIPDTIEVSVGKVSTISPIMVPEGTSTALNWYSDNTSIATAEAGRITGKKEGETFVYYSSLYGLRDTCVVRVVNQNGMDDDSDTPSVMGVIDGHEYVDLGLDVLWASYNVGATSIIENGDSFAWSETEPKSDYSKSNYIGNKTSGDVTDISIQGTSQDAAYVQWGSAWCMPTVVQYTELLGKCSFGGEAVNTEGLVKANANNGASIYFPQKNRTYWTANSGIAWSGNYSLAEATYLSTDEKIANRQHIERYRGNPVRAVSSVNPLTYGIKPTAISLSSPTKVKVTENFVLKYSITPSNATTPLRWYSENPLVASVSSVGVVEAVGVGTTKIWIETANGLKASCDVTVEGISKIEQVFTGPFCDFFLDETGTLWGCGLNNFGILNDGKSKNEYLSPKVVMHDVVQVSVGSTFSNVSLITKKDGTLWSAGSSTNGLLDNSNSSRFYYKKVMDDVAITARGDEYSYILKKNGSLWKSYKGSTPSILTDNVKSLSGGEYHALVIKNDGTLWTCGENKYGQLGDGTTTDSNAKLIKIADDVKCASAGLYHSLFVKNDGTLWGCGSNTSGQLGDGIGESTNTPVKIMDNVRSVSAGSSHTLVVKNDDTLWGFGSNNSGQLGNGTTENISTPIKIMDNVASAYAGRNQSFFIKKDGSLWGCGSNTRGELGDGSGESRTRPVKIVNGDVVDVSISVSPSTKTISVGDGFYCTYTISPSNASSQTSVTWSSDDSSIASVSSSGYVTGKKAGTTYINATTANGKSDRCKVTVETNNIKVTGISISSPTSMTVGGTQQLTATVSPSNATNKSVTWSSSNTSVATVSGAGLVTAKSAGTVTITCTASDGTGVKATCSITVSAAPVNPTEPGTLKLNVKQIALNQSHSLIVETDGTLWVCGNNFSGQLGDGTTTDRETPVKVMTDVAQVSAGSMHTMIVKTDGTLWVCGRNGYGQLGDGTATDRETPVKVMSDVAQVSAGQQHTMILKTDGTLWGCGYNIYGQLGNGSINRYTQTPVYVMNEVSQVLTGYNHTLILKVDGSLWACGSNNNGKLGDGTTTNKSTPVKVMTDVAQVSVGNVHSMMLKTDGSLWACGSNYDGQLGDGTTTNKSTPVKVMTGVAQVSAGRNHTMILKTDGTLWACGFNKYGQLGDGTTTDRDTLVKVMTDVAQVSAGGYHTMILKTDGTLWACGDNGSGQLGDGTTTTRTSFVKIAEANITGGEITVKTSDAGYATFYSAQSAYSLPRNLSAQVVTNASNRKLTYKTIADGSVSGVIPAGTAVMLVSDNKQAGTYTLTSTESKASYSGTNLLRGSDEVTTTTGDGYHYKLSYGQPGSNLSNVFGWYWGAQNGAPFQIEGHKAWLVVPKSSSSTRGFAIGGEATGIEMISGDDDVEADAVYYDLQGRRVTKPTVKGVYIKNGKKVMVK